MSAARAIAIALATHGPHPARNGTPEGSRSGPVHRRWAPPLPLFLTVCPALRMVDAADNQPTRLTGFRPSRRPVPFSPGGLTHDILDLPIDSEGSPTQQKNKKFPKNNRVVSVPQRVRTNGQDPLAGTTLRYEPGCYRKPNEFVKGSCDAVTAYLGLPTHPKQLIPACCAGMRSRTHQIARAVAGVNSPFPSRNRCQFSFPSRNRCQFSFPAPASGIARHRLGRRAQSDRPPSARAGRRPGSPKRDRRESGRLGSGRLRRAAAATSSPVRARGEPGRRFLPHSDSPRMRTGGEERPRLPFLSPVGPVRSGSLGSVEPSWRGETLGLTRFEHPRRICGAPAHPLAHRWRGEDAARTDDASLAFADRARRSSRLPSRVFVLSSLRDPVDDSAAPALRAAPGSSAWSFASDPGATAFPGWGLSHESTKGRRHEKDPALRDHPFAPRQRGGEARRAGMVASPRHNHLARSARTISPSPLPPFTAPEPNHRIGTAADLGPRDPARCRR